jgi:hypothetical protein
MNLVRLKDIKTPRPVADLDAATLAELQTALSHLGYPVGAIDGMFGPKTRSAWAEFKSDVLPGNPAMIGPDAVAALERALDPWGGAAVRDFATKEGTIHAITLECEALGLELKTQIAYVLATTQWETMRTFKPVKEAFWLSEEWRRENLRYYPYYGRGFVQLTWENNYRTYGDILGLDLVGDPDLALQPETAAFVLVHGFKVGTFTGRKISDYINQGQTDFVNARRCINGLDKAHEIASIAQTYLHGLV